MSFDCVQTTTGLWKVVCPEPTCFAAPSTADELMWLCNQYDHVLLIGVYSWSNWSRETVRIIRDNAAWFESNRIKPAICCLEKPEQVEQLCPGFLIHFMNANLEPAILLLTSGRIVNARFGPVSFNDLMKWITKK